MTLQFDGSKARKRKKKTTYTVNTIKKLGYKAVGIVKRSMRRNLRDILTGKSLLYFTVITHFITKPFTVISMEFSIMEFILALGLYIIFGIFLLLLLAFVGSIIVAALPVSLWQPVTFLQLILHGGIIILLAIFYLTFVIGTNLVVSGFKLFAREVWVEGWRKILWRCLAVPLIAGFFVSSIAWFIVFCSIYLFNIFGFIIAMLYIVPALVITLICSILMIVGWISFWRQLNKYLYDQAREGETSFNASFFILFSAFKGFAVLAGIPALLKIISSIASISMSFSAQITIGKMEESLIGRLAEYLEYALRMVVENVVIDRIFGVIAIVILVVVLILEVLDLFQLGTAIPELLRKSMTPPEGFEGMRLVVIYGSCLAYFVFTLFILHYIIPPLFNIALRVI